VFAYSALKTEVWCGYLYLGSFFIHLSVGMTPDLINHTLIENEQHDYHPLFKDTFSGAPRHVVHKRHL